MPAISKMRPLNRRRFLRGCGVALGLPMLDAMIRTPLRAANSSDPADPKPAKRLLAVCNNLGLLPDRFFPQTEGRNYELSPYLQELSAHRARLTVFSGVSHPQVDGSHATDVSFLTAAPRPGSGGFRNTISLDQFIAQQIGGQTRFASLTLGVNTRGGRQSLSFDSSGALIPPEDSAAAVYKQLFLQGTPGEVESQIRKLKLGSSILDEVADQAKSLSRRLGASDQARLDQYVTAVRDVERRLAASRQWERVRKPEPPTKAPVDPPTNHAYLEKARLMYQMARLAFETDSTRSISLFLDSTSSPEIDVPGANITDGYHNLSHHGKSAEKLAQLDAIDRAHMRLLNELFTDLESRDVGSGSLLDHTMVLYGSNLGDANKHLTTNLPILLAGGSFKHGQHLAFDRDKNYPLPNLFVSMLQQMGIEADRFASSTGTMRGLDFS